MRKDIAFRRHARRVGKIAGKGRIANADTGSFTLGWIEVNEMSTTAFTRTMVYKGYFEAGTDITNGTRVTDRSDGDRYLVMSAKPQVHNERDAWIDATVYLANGELTVKRPIEQLDSFGRSTGDYETVVADLWAVIKPLANDVIAQDDKVHQRGRLAITVQAGTDVRIGDRLVDVSGFSYKVNHVSPHEVRGLWSLEVEEDSR